MTTEELLTRYATSYYADTTAKGWFDADAQAKKLGPSAAGMTIGARAVGGQSVPILNGRELVTAMIENVEEARAAVQHTAERLARAKRDGLLDMKAFRGEEAEIQERWMGCISVVKGDYTRAVSEAKHWQDYAERASDGTLPVLKDNHGSGTELIRKLADAKSVEPDRRLPPEHEDEALF